MDNKTDILSYIECEIDNMSKGQKKIAEFILTHYDKATFMTASSLGKASAQPFPYPKGRSAL